MKTKRTGIFWGFVLLGVGVLMILSQLDVIPSLTWQQILGTVLLAYAVVELVRLHVWNLAKPIFMGLWLLKDTFSELAFFDNANWFVLLVAAVIIDAGLEYMLKPKNSYYFSKSHYKNKNFKVFTDTNLDDLVDELDEMKDTIDVEITNDEGNKNTETNDQSVFYVNTKLGAATRYINSRALKEVYVNASLAGAEVYLNRCKLKDGEASVYIDANLAGVELYVPKEWKVIVEIKSMLGGVDEIGAYNPNGTEILYIRGNVTLGGIEIIYV